MERLGDELPSRGTPGRAQRKAGGALPFARSCAGGSRADPGSEEKWLCMGCSLPRRRVCNRPGVARAGGPSRVEAVGRNVPKRGCCRWAIRIRLWPEHAELRRARGRVRGWLGEAALAAGGDRREVLQRGAH